MNRVIFPLMVIALAACEAPKQPEPPTFGNAVRHNMAVHIINPDGAANYDPTPMNGERAEQGMRNYRLKIEPKVQKAPTSRVGETGK